MLNRIFGRLAAALTVLSALSGAAQAYTAPILVVDAASGKVLYAQAATDPWYPASITKLMTTYVALDLVSRGQLSMDSMVTISPAAAAEPPSKMGFKVGTQLTLENALRIIMVKSANDVAWAVGETIGGGSVENFAAMMNTAAQRLGMRESRWVNPNGLPEPAQWTSARDMAILARALIYQFPNNQDLFNISAIQYGKWVMANHNGLIGRYTGADGMKTGFICSGGFNVVASATRGGRRIITVVMGQPSARERDLKAADLFDYGFGQSSGMMAQTLDSLPASASGAPLDIKPYVCGGKKGAPPVDEGQGAVSSGGVAGSDFAAAQLLGASVQGSQSVALAALNSNAFKGRALPPRAPLQPIAVWTGHNAEEGAAAIAEEERLAANTKAGRAEAARQKREAAKEAARLARSENAARARAAAVIDPKPKKGAVPAAANAYAPVEGAGSGNSAKAAPKAAAKTAAPAAAAKPPHAATAKPPVAGKKKSAAAAQ